MRNMIDVKSRIRHLVGTGAAMAALGAGLALSSGSAMATPATLGFYPATDIYGDKTFHLDVDTYGVALKTNGADSAGLTYGIGAKEGVLGRNEIGVDYITNAGALSAADRLLLNAKTQLYNNDASKTRVVAGVWGVGKKVIAAPNYIYLLGSKTFDWGRVHVGVARALASSTTIAAPSGQGDRTSLHLAYDKALTSKISFAADWYSGKNAYAGVQPTLYYAVNDKASFGIGWMRFNDSSVFPGRNQTYMCFDYNFGGPKAK